VTTLAVIPARLGATRLPRKPLRLLAGLPLVVRVWQRVQAMKIAADCVIATDSDEIADAARAHGAHVVMTSARHPSGTDRVAEVVAKTEFRAFDAIVNVQGDEPFVAHSAVCGALSMLVDRGFPIGTAASHASAEALQTPDVVKVVTTDDGQAMYFSRAPIPYLRERMDEALLSGRMLQHVGVYAYSREALGAWVGMPPHPLERIERLEQLRPLAAGMRIGVAVIGEVVRPGIDTESDLERANAEWNTFSPGQA
jgi:3-deoxy-manno-octulosonate cytidylyltransferase (CMP-KDO synthetase)